MKVRYSPRVLLLVFGLSLAPLGHASQARTPLIEPELLAQLAESPEQRAYAVILLEAPLISKSREANESSRLEAIFALQERVLSSFQPDEFELSYRLQNVPVLTGRISRSGVDHLASIREVRAVGIDRPGSAASVPLEDSVPFIGADLVHMLGYEGEGVTVAVLDSGIDTDHPDLIDDIAPGAWHYLNSGGNVGPGAEDSNGHGTGVSGVITSKGIVASVGVAPAADILAIQVLEPNGQGWLVDWAAGVDHVISHRGNYANLCAINMSLASNADYSVCPCDNANATNLVLQASIQAARDVGIVTFVASGNSGSCNSMKSPACVSAAVAVAMVYDQDLGPQNYVGCSDATTGPDIIVCLSDRLDGCNELAGPGRLIRAPNLGGTIMAWTGTSFATPHCAGVAALMCQRGSANCTTLSVDDTVGIMKSTSMPTQDACSSLPNPARVDAFSAVTAVGQPGVAYCFGDGTGAACPCGNGSAQGACQGCVNSTGHGSSMQSSGSDSAGIDDLQFHVAGTLPGQPGLLFAGEQVQGGGNGIVFGDGLRCAGINVVRLQIGYPDVNGTMIYGPGLGNIGGWSAGDIRYFQCWYRDPSAGPCGSGFNLTNAIKLTWAA